MISVNVATANGTATAGSDNNTALPLTRVSTTGETTTKVSVPVKGDSVAEGHETFLLNLSSPVGAVLADTQGLAPSSTRRARPPPR